MLFFLYNVVQAGQDPSGEDTSGQQEATTVQDQDQGQGQGDYTLEDVVTTATKTGETKIQETPIAISAFSEETLKNTGVMDMRDLTQWVPNAEFPNFRGEPQAFIRGVGNIVSGFYGGESNVAYYLDGAYLEGGYGANTDFIDVQRIEILRGPQGTLYGRGANGGAINIITQDPTDEVHLSSSLEYASFDKFRLDASLSGPIVKDKLKGRLSISHNQQDGYLENKGTGSDAEDSNYTGVRGKLYFTPSNIVDIRLSADYYETDNKGSGYKLITSDGFFATGLGAKVADGFYDFYSDVDSYDKMKVSGVSANASIKLPKNMLIRSITTVRSYERDLLYDNDGTDLDLITNKSSEEVEQFSEELQLQAQWDSWQWVAGIFLHKQTSEYTELIQSFPASMLGSALDETWGFDGPSSFETKSYAGFANLKYAATKRLNLEAGIRYSKDEKKMATALIADYGSTGTSEINATNEADFESVTPKIGLDYQVCDNALVYASAARGFRPGHFDLNNTLYGFTGDSRIEPEYTWSYEAGIKTDWFDNRLRANLTAFYIDYKDMQVSTIVNGYSISSNAAEASIKGVELELLARPLPAVTLNATASYLNGQYDNFTAIDPYDSTATVDVSGNQLAYAPEWKLCLGAQYVFELSQGFLTFRGDVSWKDKTYFNQYELDATSQDAYALLNALIRFETRKGNWAVDLYAKNLTGEEYYTNEQLGLDSSDVIALVGQPRTFGIKLTYKF